MMGGLNLKVLYDDVSPVVVISSQFLVQSRKEIVLVFALAKMVTGNLREIVQECFLCVCFLWERECN